MARLSDVRRWFPPEDASMYAAAYAEAELAERLGTLVQALRKAACLDAAELAARTGVHEDELGRAEEGDASMTLGLLDRLAREAGVQVTLAGAGVEVVLGAVAPAPGIGAEPGGPSLG
ncbi:MAG: helix-turn-helix transcriptional regulator [Actinomycetota bacterium]|nr:helix-turn-helix transcriptional regulator [Actinomycetota bacterium]